MKSIDKNDGYFEAVVFLKQGEGFLPAVSNVGVSRQVDVALLLDPGQGLSGRTFEQTELLVLIQPLLLRRPVFQNAILLGQKLFQND